MGTLRISQRLRTIDKRVAQFTGPRMIRIMNEAAREMRDYIKSRFMGGGRTSANRLARNTGDMERKTVARRAETVSGVTKAVVAINTPYASVHFGEGGRLATLIRPKHAKALAVPMAAVKGPNQRPVLPAKSSQITGKFAFGGTLYGRLPGQKTQGLFSLRSSVVVPVRIQVERDIQPVADKVIRRLIDQEIQKIFGGS